MQYLSVEIRTSKGVVLLDEEDASRFSHTSIWVAAAGYPTIYWNGKCHYVHRVVTNAQKGEQVDHINGDRLDARKANLRLCSQSENLMNARLRSDNTSGHKGVYWCQRDKCWYVQIWAYGKLTHLGAFRDFNAAVMARRGAQAELHGEFARTNEANF